eukprot:6737385-Alexandrium_andersonii.AAC.1
MSRRTASEARRSSSISDWLRPSAGPRRSTSCGRRGLGSLAWCAARCISRSRTALMRSASR